MTLTTFVLIAAPAFALGTGFGWWSYRRQLRRNPAKLEALAAEAKRAGEKIKDQVRG